MPTTTFFERTTDKRAIYLNAKARENKQRNNYLMAFGIAIEKIYEDKDSEGRKKMINFILTCIKEKEDKKDKRLKKRIIDGFSALDEKLKLKERIYLVDISEVEAKKINEQHGNIIFFDKIKKRWYTHPEYKDQCAEWIPAPKQEKEEMEWIAWQDIELQPPEDTDKFKDLINNNTVTTDNHGRYFLRQGQNLLLVKKYLPQVLSDFLNGKIFTEKSEAIAVMKIGTFTINKKRGQYSIKKGTDVSEVIQYLPELLQSLFVKDRSTWDSMWSAK